MFLFFLDFFVSQDILSSYERIVRGALLRVGCSWEAYWGLKTQGTGATARLWSHPPAGKHATASMGVGVGTPKPGGFSGRDDDQLPPG